MKPAPFDYHAPDTLNEALGLREKLGPDATVLAGGQSLVPMLNLRLASPTALIDLRKLDELRYMRATPDGVAVGAMVTHRTLERSDEAHAVCPLLRESLELVAHAIVRNRGTIGGSIAHADPAAELPTVLAVLSGKVTVRSAHGERQISASELFTFHFTTSLEPGRDPDRDLVPRGTRRRWLGVPRGQPPPRRLRARRRGLRRRQRKHATRLHRGRADARCRRERRPRRGRSSRLTRRRHPCDGRLPPPAGPRAGRARRRASARARQGKGVNKQSVRVTVNGDVHEREVEPRLLLSDFLRHDLGLTGTHVGCEHGVCGCCTVRVDGEAVRSCLMFAAQVDGAEIATIEGLAPANGDLHPIQEAFRECHGLQCGFCTPGFVMAISAYLEEEQRADLTDEEVREAISGNLCRCTGYQNIVEAVKHAAKTMYGGS